jgi:NitT/TauT family transport system ATP-binding protein
MGFRCHQVAKKFKALQGEVTALDGVDFSVGEEEFVCIVGPSGCGKTTLLKIIAGLIQPTSGQVIYDPSDTNHHPESAMVFQDQGLFPWMTVLDNVAFGLEMRGVDRRARVAQAEDFLSRVGLGNFIHSYPHELSGGMRQRVAILRAFLTDPIMLLMDEPFGGLDSQTRLVMQEELLRIWKEHRKTVLYVTHDIEEAILLSDRILVMSGRPGTLREDIPIPLPRPRQFADRNRPEASVIYERIWNMIENEVRKDLRIQA